MERYYIDNPNQKYVNDLFEQSVNAMQGAMHSNSVNPPKAIFLYGIGEIGKTTITDYLKFDEKKECTVICNCEKDDNVQDVFVKIANCFLRKGWKLPLFSLLIDELSKITRTNVELVQKESVMSIIIKKTLQIAAAGCLNPSGDTHMPMDDALCDALIVDFVKTVGTIWNKAYESYFLRQCNSLSQEIKNIKKT